MPLRAAEILKTAFIFVLGLALMMTLLLLFGGLFF